MSNINTVNYQVNETVFKKDIEVNFEMEMNLPDYCADIGSMLQCFAFPNITSSEMTSECINIEGDVLVRVLYLNDGEIYSFEQSVPFSEKMEHNFENVGAVLDIKNYVQYVNCRAGNSRRFEVHGAFILSAKVNACQSKSVIQSIENDTVQTNEDFVSACSASGNATSDIVLSQVVDIGSGKPAVKSIIRNSAFALITQTKQVNGKILIKGELKIKTLYKSEDNTTEYIENALALSQILDIDGMTEDSIVDIKTELIALNITAKPSALGSMSLLDMNAVVRVNACSYNCIDFPVLKDCYSTKYESTCTFKTVHVDRIIRQLSKEYLHTITLKDIKGISRVIDVWCDNLKCQPKSEEDLLKFNGSLKVYMLYEDENGTLKLKQADSEFSFDEAVEGANALKCEPSVYIAGNDYLLGEEQVEIRVKLNMNAVIFDSLAEKVVDDISLSETELEKKSSLIIYYAKSGETLWNIARKYNTTLNILRTQNSLEGDIITQDKPLLIWSV